MIDGFCIFERGGTVLWRRSYVPLKGDPLAVFVRSVLLQDRLSLQEFSYDSYTLLWELDNQRGLVFLVIFQSKLRPAYANDLLQLVRKEFVRQLQYTKSANGRAQCIDTSSDYASFGTVFEDVTAVAEKRAKQDSDRKSSTLTRRRSAERIKNAGKQSEQRPGQQPRSIPDENQHPDTVSSEEYITRKRLPAPRRVQGASHRSRKPKTKTHKSEATASSKPRTKFMRPSTKSQQEEVSNLDFSAPPPEDYVHDEDADLKEFRERYLPADGERGNVSTSLSEDDDAEEQAQGGVFSYFKALAGMRTLTRSDLEPVMQQFRDFLISKNVAKDIADKLMESVLTSLTGKKMDSLTSLTSTVRRALDEALTRILTARQSTDIVAEISAKRNMKVPYVITYCGVNGVGKSTSLAKTCYYLLNHGFKVMIAACDTFRAGAVEQLRTHVKCLGEGVELFDKGYGKDAAAVAADAIRRAKELQYDVVLVDTAGRMQDNEPLMRALAKLVEVNRPDRLFFVGEALVGNDAVDQLTKFNQALVDHQSGARPQLIDGIVLTKFDTIDDKVGAAVSMVYTTGQPIVFVGVGQTYTDLRKVNTRSLVNALMK
ncbi:Signal recognition particle receptor subunit alpha [Gracilariopsis chorda]|uniref:Signal recognition particle receptor subunit alpha n=1 Tax=Gracilariopsis chorda TaxID=448386 RepID=A0A2V3IKR3_9FLOR|nr:Signal recognition particle receptor subunit alpha [Gracilariopsis chorda]|eukprot:PXF41720.1 Signal recognition particle receptor subunit alpha [Gracilariopsis chorda]